MLDIFTLQGSSILPQDDMEGLGVMQDRIILPLCSWTSSTLSQLEEYDVRYAIHHRNLAVSKGYQFNEGM